MFNIPIFNEIYVYIFLILYKYTICIINIYNLNLLFKLYPVNLKVISNKIIL